MLKKICKIFILYLFISGRFSHYDDIFKESRFIATEQEGYIYKLDFETIHLKYEGHQLFVIPFLRNISEIIKNYIVKRNINLSQNLHSNLHDNSPYLKKTFELIFIIIYDILMVSLIIFLFSSDSIIISSVLIYDSGSEIIIFLINQYQDLNFSKFEQVLCNFFQQILNILMSLLNFVSKDKTIAVNVAKLGFLFLLVIQYLKELSNRKQERICPTTLELKEDEEEVDGKLCKNLDKVNKIKKEDDQIKICDLAKLENQEIDGPILNNFKLVEHTQPNKKNRSNTPSKRNLFKSTL